jgi:outer membrane protein assembly factor BamB
VSRRRKVLAGVAVAAIVALGIGAWWYHQATRNREVRGSPTVEYQPHPKPQKRPLKQVALVPWPTYGYDSRRDRVSPFKLRPPFRQLWMVRSGFYLEFPPSVGYGLVFVSQLKGRFLAIEPKTGKIEWERKFPYCSAASPTLAGGLVSAAYIPKPCTRGPRSVPGLVVAMRPSDGKIVWRFRRASESTPVVAKGVVYFGAWDHRVYALRLETGKLLWSTLTDGEIDSSPAYAGRTVFIGNNAGSLYAIDARNGRVRWIGRSFSTLFYGREYFYPTPAVAYGRVFAPNTDGTVYAFGATSGHLLWARHVGTYVYTAPAVWDQKVYVGTYDGKFVALDAGTGDVKWSYEAVSAVHGAPTVMDGLVYFAACGACGQHGSRYAKPGPRGTFALNALTGKLVWSFPDGHYSPIVADSERVYLTGSTRVYGLEPRSLPSR